MTSLFDSATVLWHYLAAKRRLGSISSRTDVDRIQTDGIKRFRQKVMARSPFYRDYVDSPLSEIPIITKREMLENFDRMNTAGIKLSDALEVGLQAEKDRDFSPMIGNITVGLSSGTSGSRGVFLVSKEERLRWAGTMLAHALPHSILKPTRIAFFLRANSNLYTTLNRGRHLVLDFYDITAGQLMGKAGSGKGIEAYVDKLTRTQPDVLVAPASILRHLAHRAYTGDLFINPKRIFSVGEVLDPHDKTYIEDVFKMRTPNIDVADKIRVDQIYQCTEGFLGISDALGTIRLNEAFVLIEKEWIDEASGRFRPVITDFSRTTQPIIRYRLDDILIEDRFNKGPFTALSQIEGRADSTLYFPTFDGKLKPIFADVVRQAVLASELGSAEYQIAQKAPDDIEMRWGPAPAVPGPIHTKTFQHLLNDLADRYDCLPPTGVVTPLYRPPYDVKVRRIVRNFPVLEGQAQ
jgi:putative adenylate-forming enzyme